MTERSDAARTMRADAERLRKIATSKEAKLSGQLFQLAKDIEEEAARLETGAGTRFISGDGGRSGVYPRQPDTEQQRGDQ